METVTLAYANPHIRVGANWGRTVPQLALKALLGLFADAKRIDATGLGRGFMSESYLIWQSNHVMLEEWALAHFDNVHVDSSYPWAPIRTGTAKGAWSVTPPNRPHINANGDSFDDLARMEKIFEFFTRFDQGKAAGVDPFYFFIRRDPWGGFSAAPPPPPPPPPSRGRGYRGDPYQDLIFQASPELRHKINDHLKRVPLERASAEDLKFVYRKILLEVHPDRPGGSVEKAQRANAAMDEILRRKGAS